MRFVVTGTGRSGTGYAAHLFTAAGLPCGHEAAFTDKPAWGETAAPRAGFVARAKEPLGRLRENRRRDSLTLAGDASWMAVPRLAEFHGPTFLQTRHPIPVIRSFVGTRFFSDPTVAGAQHRYAAAFMRPTGNDVVDAMRWWVLWNQMAEKSATRWWQVEELDAVLLTDLLIDLDVDDPGERAHRAFAQVPHNVNSGASRGDHPGDLTWDDLPDGEDKDELEAVAARFGYAVT